MSPNQKSNLDFEYASLYLAEAPHDEWVPRQVEAMNYILWYVAHDYSAYGSLFN